jgi:predicted nucleotidyltransferase
MNLACAEVRKRKHNSFMSNSCILTKDEVMEELKKKQKQKELKNEEKLKRIQEKQEKRKKKMLENHKLIMKIEELQETTGITWSSLNVKQLKAVLFVQKIKIHSTTKKIDLILLVT